MLNDEWYKAMTETAFQNDLMAKAKQFGWLTYHTYDSRRSERGHPDLTLVRAPTIILAELKKWDGMLSRDQQRWRAALQACTNFEYHVWRPQNTDDILEILK